jgi:Zn-dependent M28 family amino/carboxypeptidase
LLLMKKLVYLSTVVLIAACSQSKTESTASDSLFDTLSMYKHIEVLSSDLFEGRKPFTEGETKTVAYLTEQFIAMGLQPGNGDSYTQDVPLVSITGTPDDDMVITGGKQSFTLSYGDEFVAYTEKGEAVTSINASEVVFAGYGVVAPEYGWNDYEGLDVKGKTVLVMVNDPGFESEDSTLFKGKTMTYYGRWTYKYEEAARQGAAGVLIIHETVPAGYPWMVVSGSWSGAKLQLAASSGYKCDVQGWVTRAAAIKLFKASEAGIKDYKKLAGNASFKPVPLGISASISVSNEIREDVSYNVIAKIEGSERPNEVVIYTAHWDHLGIGNPVDGDSIYNGAYDNASGTAALLAVAEAFANGVKPKRTVVFLAVTAEEQGLLGSAHYAENPIYPAEQTVANINIDGANRFGRMKDFTIVGFGQSDMDDWAGQVAQQQGRYIYPDPHPGKGYFFRSDHFSFAKIGIPALYGSGTYEAELGGVKKVEKILSEYLSVKYHQPSDEFDPEGWRFGGMLQDVELVYEVGSQLAESELWPGWKEGSEFKSLRTRQ